MKLYNTLGRKVEEFKPINPNKIKLYTCGPTVYDYMHIGNLRKFVFDDTLRRALESSGFEVQHVMNITDVGHLVSDTDEGEDKLEKGAKREGKTVWDVAKTYTDSFKNDVQKMNVLAPNGYQAKNDVYARATDFISEQIAMIKLLIEKGFAYQTPQAIYFDVTKLSSYGELTGQKLSDKEIGAREEVIKDQNKHHPQDFAVWFFTVGRFANHDMHWASPWGEGFPGWHLECSAIIHATLGDPIDIHTGGVDNIGTHHVNEMAQTEAAFGHKLANYWIHSEHLLVDDQKMAKSLGNFYTLADVIKKGFDPLALRLLFLQAHYRSQLNFTWKSLEAVSNLLKSLNGWADLQFQSFNSESLANNYKEALGKFQKALEDDLNTPQALAILSDMINKADALGADSVAVAEATTTVEKVFGLGLDKRKDIDRNQKVIIAERETARQKQNWQKADELRAKLAAQGIEIKDNEHGPIWMRI